MINLASAPVEDWPIEKVLPYPENHKKHPPSQIEMLAKSISSEGLNDPLTVDFEGVIISGHGRFEALKKLGWKTVPVRCLKGLSKAQADKLRIAANKTSSNEYDFDALQRELIRLSGDGEDITNLGLTDKEISTMIETIDDFDADSIMFDIGDEVDDFEGETKEMAEAAKDKPVSLTKLLGTTKVSSDQFKDLTRFFAVIEKRTGKEGLDALMAHAKQFSGDAA